MINEEYNYDDVSDYLEDKIDLLIVGVPGKDEREKFFCEKWLDLGKDFLISFSNVSTAPASWTKSVLVSTK